MDTEHPENGSPNLLIHAKSTLEYFREQVESAISHRHVDCSESASFYIVNLLSDNLDTQKLIAAKGCDEPLVTAITAANAEEIPTSGKVSALKWIGDYTLVITGLFGDSLSRKLVDANYYIALGKQAYLTIASLQKRHTHRKTTKPENIYRELGLHFADFVDVLTEVGENTGLNSHSSSKSLDDILRVYDFWLKTGSGKYRETLLSHGVIPINDPRIISLQ